KKHHCLNKKPLQTFHCRRLNRAEVFDFGVLSQGLFNATATVEETGINNFALKAALELNIFKP
ncbi:MAG: hypothetical protein ACYTEM_00710, partial [Planctomycetota bacterium]